MEEISRGDVLFFSDVMANVLISMGIEPRMAAEVVLKFSIENSKYSAMTESMLISTSDTLTSCVDFSERNLNKYVSFITTGDKIIDTALSMIGVGLVVHKILETKKAHRVVFSYDDTTRREIMNKFHGKTKRYAAMKWLNIAPTFPIYRKN